MYDHKTDAPLSEARDWHRTEFLLDDLGTAWKEADGDRNTALGVFVDRRAYGHIRHSEHEPTEYETSLIEQFGRLVRTCRSHGVDFGAAVARVCQLRSMPGEQAMWLVGRFTVLGAFSAANLISRDQLLLLGDKPDWWNYQRTYESTDDRRSNPASLLLWMELQGPSAAHHLLEGLNELGLPDFLRLARSLAYALGVWLKFSDAHHPEAFSRGGQDFAILCRRVFDEADRRERLHTTAQDDLRHVWLRFAWMAIEADDEWLTPEIQTRLIRAASDEIGRLRPLLRQASKDDEARLKDLEPHFRSCVALLFKLGSLWEATKPLLLAFRATRSRAVGYDLRYWPVGRDDDPPSPWEMVPRSLMNLLHHYMGEEQEDDPKLEAYRSAFALFCLERLKSRRPAASEQRAEDQAQVESDPAWREGFIQAVRALRVNPKGKGHHILNWVKGNDPDPGVKETASTAYAELRHQPSLPQGYSPRRAVFDAFWWLRQAHLASLGERIDQAGASQTREEEARRTTESERKP